MVKPNFEENFNFAKIVSWHGHKDYIYDSAMETWIINLYTKALLWFFTQPVIY